MPVKRIGLSRSLLVVDDRQQMRSVVKRILADPGPNNVFPAARASACCRACLPPELASTFRAIQGILPTLQIKQSTSEVA
jgi:CheY-like chemotaxis protein